MIVSIDELWLPGFFRNDRIMASTTLPPVFFQLPNVFDEPSPASLLLAAIEIDEKNSSFVSLTRVPSSIHADPAFLPFPQSRLTSGVTPPSLTFRTRLMPADFPAPEPRRDLLKERYCALKRAESDHQMKMSNAVAPNWSSAVGKRFSKTNMDRSGRNCWRRLFLHCLQALTGSTVVARGLVSHRVRMTTGPSKIGGGLSQLLLTLPPPPAHPASGAASINPRLQRRCE